MSMTARNVELSAWWRATTLVCSGGLLTFAGACDGTPTATFIQPVLQGDCSASECSADGVCVADANGRPVCACAIGYRGPSCELCEDTFHRDALDRCVSDKLCADQPEDPCSPHGTCSDAEGVLLCVCETGYQGPRCNLCADDMAWSGRAQCELVPKSEPDAGEPWDGGDLPDAGSVGNEDAGDAGNANDAGPIDGGLTDAAPPDAGPHDAGPHDAGTHDAGPSDSGPPDAGSCPTGYTGPGCTACAASFHSEGAFCVPDESCLGEGCSGHGTCQVVAGKKSCACQPGHGGSVCQCQAETFTETFELVPAWPDTVNTCSGRSQVTVTNFYLRSLVGQGLVHMCAPSTFNGFATHFIELEAGPTQAAEIFFRHTATAVAFKFSANLEPLSLDVLANGRLLRTLEVPKFTNGALTLPLAQPAAGISFRSRSPYIQRIGLDDISYTVTACE